MPGVDEGPEIPVSEQVVREEAKRVSAPRIGVLDIAKDFVNRLHGAIPPERITVPAVSDAIDSQIAGTISGGDISGVIITPRVVLESFRYGVVPDQGLKPGTKVYEAYVATHGALERLVEIGALKRSVNPNPKEGGQFIYSIIDRELLKNEAGKIDDQAQLVGPQV